MLFNFLKLNKDLQVYSGVFQESFDAILLQSCSDPTKVRVTGIRDDQCFFIKEDIEMQDHVFRMAFGDIKSVSPYVNVLGDTYCAHCLSVMGKLCDLNDLHRCVKCDEVSDVRVIRNRSNGRGKLRNVLDILFRL